VSQWIGDSVRRFNPLSVPLEEKKKRRILSAPVNPLRELPGSWFTGQANDPSVLEESTRGRREWAPR